MSCFVKYSGRRYIEQNKYVEKHPGNNLCVIQTSSFVSENTTVYNLNLNALLLYFIGFREYDSVQFNSECLVPLFHGFRKYDSVCFDYERRALLLL